jgi:AAA domain-containing protein
MNGPRDLPELRDFIRSRRAALFGFMEQGAALELNGDVLTVIPRNDIYIRYLNDNCGAIGELASECFGRTIRVVIDEKRQAGTSVDDPADGRAEDAGNRGDDRVDPAESTMSNGKRASGANSGRRGTLAENLRADSAEIHGAIGLLCEPGEVYELRALGTTKGTVSGYFADFEKLAGNATGCSDRLQADGVYLTLNPVKHDLLARASNRLEGYAKHTSADADIVARRWLPLDFDPVRPAGISSTDVEHEAALAKARECIEVLKGAGFPDPVVADSGNGSHLLYRIDLPNDDASRDLLRRVLDSLDSLLSDEAITVDKTTFNAARIWKLYGTPTRKGDSLPDRPHRLARIRETPATLQLVTHDQLDEIAQMLPKSEPLARSNSTAQSSFNLENWIAAHGIDVARESTWSGGRRWILRHCLFDPSHGGSGAAILQLSRGAIVYRCLHNSCADRKWADLREQFEPGYQQRRALALASNGAQVPVTTAPARQTSEQAITIKMSDIEPEAVEWLWPDRLALGKLNLLVDDPGNGKSFATLDIAARVSTGRNFPDGAPCPRGSVIIITGEDGIADTVRPRLDAQGADVTRVHHFKIKLGDSERQFDIGADLDRLKEKIREIGDVRLLIIDPLTAYLGDVDSNKDAKVRGLLTPLAALAEEMRVAILAVMHLNKAAVMDAIYRVTGSVAFIAQARSAWAVVPDVQDSSRRLFLKLKANLAPADIPGLAFIIAANEGGRPVLTWSNEAVTVSLRDVMGGFSNTRRGPKPDKLEAAKALIARILSDGAEHPGADLDAAAKAAGISNRTLNEAAKALGIQRRKAGFTRGWLWSMTPRENSASSPDSNGNSASSQKATKNKGFSQDRNSASSSANSEGAEFIGYGKSPHLGEQEDVCAVAGGGFRADTNRSKPVDRRRF